MGVDGMIFIKKYKAKTNDYYTNNVDHNIFVLVYLYKTYLLEFNQLHLSMNKRKIRSSRIGHNKSKLVTVSTAANYETKCKIVVSDSVSILKHDCNYKNLAQCVNNEHYQKCSICNIHICKCLKNFDLMIEDFIICDNKNCNKQICSNCMNNDKETFFECGICYVVMCSFCVSKQNWSDDVLCSECGKKNKIITVKC